MQIPEPGGPGARFLSLVPIAMTPRPAQRDAGGSLPIRAARYCEAITSACAFGWWLYPPMDAWLFWDGSTIFYSLDGESYEPLDDSCEYPGMAEALAEHVPEGIAPIASALFTALPEPGIVQVSLGLIASTAPGWSMLLRRPANLPLFGGYDALEGIVETDIWRAPLFINLRLTRTHTPIRLHAMAPLVQAQPLPQWLYQPETMADLQCGGLDAMTPDDWSAWEERFVEPADRPLRRDGEYATASRKRQRGRCPGASARDA
ncbi:MAG: DUF6065 family protein [Acetobacteraceae bacterium]|nr:DUF6065 family protein [Acetobacteraceae bacterium]